MPAQARVWHIPPETTQTSPAEAVVAALQASGFFDRLTSDDDVAIKVHMSERGNVRGIRPLWARRLADAVQEAGASPFITDTTTLYKHGRSTALEYLETAARHGFTSETMGCPVIIADGFHNSGTYVELADAEFRRVHVAQAIHEAEAMISLAHCTFHSVFPIAGTIKNLGMGCTTKEAKMAMHQHEAAPGYNPERCVGCWVCLRICPGDAFSVGDGVAQFSAGKCLGCGDCIGNCKGGALHVKWDADQSKTQTWTLDAARAVLSTFDEGKVAHVGLGVDITRECDCGVTGLPAACDTGFFVSLDPLALDVAMWDALHEAPIYPGGPLDRLPEGSESAARRDLGGDRATPLWPHVGTRRFWGEIAPASGLGSLDYCLCPVP